MGGGVADGQFHRLADRNRRSIRFRLDGADIEALEGDTLLTAILLSRGQLRESEFGDGPRAGFCLMGACQDCWIWQSDGKRLRACSTYATEGLDLRTKAP
jgi:predicted molibdopterin-dependent oxidoreductase YjgC